MNLSKEVRNIEDTYERINFLKDKFKGKTAYLITCGPSLTKLDHATLNKKLKGKLVIALKQAYNYVKDVATFHGMSCYGYQPYEYTNDDTLVHWQLTAMNAQNEVYRIKEEWKHKHDILIPCYSTPWISMDNTTAFSRNFSNFLAYKEGKIIWGPGILYETGIPLALHLGCKDIVTIGWDIGDLSKFKPEGGYKLGDDDWRKEHAEDLYANGVHAGAGPDYVELKETIDCTKEMYDWFLENKINFRILSNTNPADERFERITLEDL